ncbi:MAG TPA: glycosyltransferase family 2 protein [Armatimonadota bacterium]|nr:glycosyltransferase family 2 protein [Armatimonadota bacterium]
MTRTSISAVIITFNEEANIRRCLESVKWADEIVVVDSGSSDGTLKICKEYGCRVFNHEWEGYARQKNFAIGSAAADAWILSLDADEEVTPELADEIRAALNSNDAAHAYSMPRRNLFLGKWMRHGGWYPDRQVRLFKRGAGEFKDVPLHEHIVMHVGSGRTGSLASPILHYTYPTARDFIERMNLYTSIEVAAMAKEGRLPKHLLLSLAIAFPLKFAETYIYKGGWRDGLHGFIAAVLMATRVFLRQVKVWEASTSTGERDIGTRKAQ